MSAMWSVIRSSVRRQSSPPRHSRPQVSNYRDMMELYRPDIDDVLARLQQAEPPLSAEDSRRDLDQDSNNELEEDNGAMLGESEGSSLDLSEIVTYQPVLPPNGAPELPEIPKLDSWSKDSFRTRRKKRSDSVATRAHRSGEGTSPQLNSLPHSFSLIPSPREDPPRFFEFLIKAVKTDNISAVEIMCRAAEEAGVNLGETREDTDFNTVEASFTEREYTATVLHVALLFKHLQIAKILITRFPDLVKIQYTAEHLRGQTAFHIAAANNDLEIMALMLNAIQGTDKHGRRALEIDRRATGTHFEESNQVGALCLTAALWAGHLEMVRLLLKEGANMAATGPSGNTALHQLVKFSNKYREKQTKAQDMFKLFWEFSDRDTSDFADGEYCAQRANHNKVVAMRKLLSIRNDLQQTPLMLAVNLQAPIAKYLLNFEPVYRQPQTKYGSTSWITYDVTDVTSYDPDEAFRGRYNPCSVLHILAHRAKIVSSEDETFQDLIRVQPVSDLVKMKWKVYRWVYYLWAFFHVINMVGLTLFATQCKYGPDRESPLSARKMHASADTPEKSTTGYIGNEKHFAWIFVLLPLIYIIAEIEDLICVYVRSSTVLSTRGLVKAMWTVTGNGPFRVTLLCFSICSLVWVSLVEVGHSDEDVPLAFALALGWIFMLFFTRGFKSTARFSIMVQKMFFQDFLYFFSIYSFIWIAFASAMQALVHDTQSVGITLYSMLNIMTDAGEKATEHTSRRPELAAVILSCYAVISVILLLNMLIAMMNASYDAVKLSKTKLYRYQQLSILLMIERRLFWFSWLCKRSQALLRSPDASQKDELKNESKARKTGNEMEMGLANSVVDRPTEKLTSKRMYVEVTESTFAAADEEENEF